MKPLTWLAGTAVGLTLALVAVSPAPASAADAAKKDVQISIRDATIWPSTARVLEGGSVVFDNDSESLAAVSFPLAILKDLECKDVRPQWMREATDLLSMPLEGDAPDLALPCTLKKGTYPYTVRLFNAIANMDNPKQTLKATLIVE